MYINDFCSAISSNTFSTETAGPIELKFHMDGGMKVCSIDPDHMTKMVATPISCVVKPFKNRHKNQKAENLGTWCLTSMSNLILYIFKRETI